MELDTKEWKFALPALYLAPGQQFASDACDCEDALLASLPTATTHNPKSGSRADRPRWCWRLDFTAAKARLGSMRPSMAWAQGGRERRKSHRSRTAASLLVP